MHRVAFDPALPVVAASPFTAGERSFSAKDPVDWRELGITEQVLFHWWQAGLVVHPVEAVTPPETGEPAALEQTASAPPARKPRRPRTPTPPPAAE